MSASALPRELELADRITSWLQTPAAYSPAPDRVERIDTHISRVFLAGSLVYKLKKSVKFDFLDFSTLAAREHACREEVRLNRRLAADIYLGVVPITLEDDQQLRIDGRGRIVEWLLKMRRLPTEKTLPQLHHRGELKPYHIDRLADLLVRFYAAQQPVAIAPATYRQDCLRHVQDNRRELLSVAHHLPRTVVLRS
ncbi:MAG TPA: hypothetical protein VL096_15875, partial [Pirellulaceae bacterium]|nr:hypothetical protein [Pirellulaceae bacterium]